MPARFETIAAWVNASSWTQGAELGVFDGRTYLYLLEHCPQLTLIGVDVWNQVQGFTEGQTKSGERCFCKYCSDTRHARRSETVAAMRKRVIRESARYGRRAQLYIQLTTEVAKLVNDKTMDFVFVDGDHSREGVSADIAAWLPKVKSGGRLIGHDFNMASVRAGVHEHFAPSDLVMADDHLWTVPCW